MYSFIQTKTTPTANRMINPSQLPICILPAAPFEFLKGALSVASGFEAAEVLLSVCVPLELVLSAAILVVTVVLLVTLSLEADPDELDDVDEGRCVVVNVLPAEFVVVMTCPTVIVVSVDTVATVDGDPVAVVVLHSVTGNATAMTVPD